MRFPFISTLAKEINQDLATAMYALLLIHLS